MRNQQVIFHVVPSLVPAGAERVVVDLLRHHDRAVYQPVCICLGSPFDSHYEAAVHQMGIPLYFLGKGDAASWGAYQKLERLFIDYRPTVVHTHLTGLSYAYWLMLKYHTPVRVHTLHSLAQREIGNRVGKLVRLLAFRYRWGRVVPVAISGEVARTITELYGYPDPPVILNGVAVQEYAPNPSRRARMRQENAVAADAVVVAHVGRFVPLKNHAMLLQAFAGLRSENPLFLWLVGGGELLQPMQNLAEELGIAPRVRFWGVRHDVPEILNAADVFAFPSQYEGFGLAVVEAMAAGLPIVATKIEGVSEIVEDGVSGLLSPKDDLAAFTAALQQLVDDATLRCKLGAAAQQRAQQYDVSRMVRQYEALYEQILSSRRSRG